MGTTPKSTKYNISPNRGNVKVEIADNDELFDYKHGLKSFERVKEICKNVGTDWINLILFEGVHEFCKDDEPIRKLIMDIE